MLKIFLSKKGFSLTEMMSVIIVLGILTAIAVPTYNGALYIQRKKDCKNNRLTMETRIQQAMNGMIDNGAPQKNSEDQLYINFERADPEHLSIFEYNGEEVTCFKIQANTEEQKNLAFTLADLRCGYYTSEQAILDLQYINQFNEIPKLPDGKIWKWAKYVKELNITTSERKFEEIENSLKFCKYEMGCKKTKYIQTSNNEYQEENIGYFLKKQDIGDTPFYTYFDNQEIPVCAFSTDETPYFYYVLGDGTVVCDCPECQN